MGLEFTKASVSLIVFRSCKAPRRIEADFPPLPRFLPPGQDCSSRSDPLQGPARNVSLVSSTSVDARGRVRPSVDPVLPLSLNFSFSASIYCSAHEKDTHGKDRVLFPLYEIDPASKNVRVVFSFFYPLNPRARLT
jgi:hypothetical protein